MRKLFARSRASSGSPASNCPALFAISQACSAKPETSRASRGSPACGRGFTLLELLVVIMIISILASVLVIAVRTAITGARSAATITTIQKVSNDFKTRMQNLSNHIQSLETQFDKYVVDNGYFKQAGYDQELGRVLAKKDFFRRTFPQRFSELGITGDATQNGTESAEVLYYSITGEDIPNSSEDADGDGMLDPGEDWDGDGVLDTVRSFRVPGYMAAGRDVFSTSDYGDTDSDGRLEVLDGWGRPLRFYRWPTRLVRPSGATIDSKGNVTLIPPTQAELGIAAVLNRGLPSAADLARDPDDPLALTQKPKWSGAASFESDFHTLGTFHTLLIVSPGPDNTPGLYEPTDTSSNFGYLAKVADADALLDDITNLNAKAGGN